MKDVQVGQRIRLMHMGPDPDALPYGAEGTVTSVAGKFEHRDLFVSVAWDCGRTLTLVCPPDSFVVIA